jgi:hypothetical protein
MKTLSVEPFMGGSGIIMEAFLVQAKHADSSWLAKTCMDRNGNPVNDIDLEAWCLVLACRSHERKEVEVQRTYCGLDLV